MEEKEELIRLYQLYLNNRCTAEELNRFFILINKGKEEENLVQLLSATWDQIPLAPETGLLPYFLPQENPQQTAAIPDQHLATRNTGNPDIPFPKSYPMFRYVAAIAAMLLLVCGIYFYRAELWTGIAGAPKMEIASVGHDRKQLQLSDGTKVWLSPHSKLTYPANFEGNNRLVSLDGEAFFEVAHDANHPFIIQSGKVSTRVLGTSFSLSAYPKEEDVNITLLSGKVAVSLDAAGKTREAVITANQRISVDKKQETISTINFPDAKDFLDRRLGLFDYKGTPLAEVIEDLEMQYQVQINLSPELQDHRFYGHLNMNTTLLQSLQKLCTVMESNWKKDGGQYVITK
ncbi:FecR domain-containing protein [Pedobacter sp. PLR]|uniref:FecR family protein n=1 Tax=Pedobacter sp. PLR TaxID=2994465 RepID=UPI002246A7FE|nr:FecR family protein [Pedobacter sp. PLR]MCX2453165.1 FecR domain-containing protein [Pedobacter sp. PLR]